MQVSGQGTSRQRGQQVYSPEASVSLKGGRKPVWGRELGTTVGEVEVRDIGGRTWRVSQAIVRLRLSHLSGEKPLKDIAYMSNWISLAVKSRQKRRQE